ncbi:hypothetical protein [Larkinella soli]|uniref:hypothetical protein n=1 Tax=Larkinella soli TaxID=1770527 RepID=UPI00286E186C|nr:hypothetical protein [Larkinella soli]
MTSFRTFLCLLLLTGFLPHSPGFPTPPHRKTTVAIRGEQFFINGRPTFRGRNRNGNRIEGLLPNARMVQGIFDDRNSDTRARWAYPDTRT